MGFAAGFANIVSLFRPTTAPSQEQVNQQAAVGGGSDSSRDKLVKDDRRSRSLKVTGQKVLQKQMLDRCGVTKPAAAKRA